MNLSLGLTLMLIGMATVFVIMFLIILILRGLIHLVNAVAPAKEAAVKPGCDALQQVDSLTASIIAGAVKQITGGAGTVTTIRKI